MELRLDLRLERAEAPITYAGEVEIADDAFPIRVTVDADEGASDGLSASAEAATVDDAWRARIERLAASVARKAVRGARKDDMKPPRRIRRWRALSA